MYYYNYLNLLKITSNIPLLNKIHETESVETLDLRFLIREEKYFKTEIEKLSDLIYLGRDFYYSHNESLVCYKKNFLMNFYICVKNLEGYPTELSMSDNFRYLKVPLRDLPGIPHMFNSLLMLKLIPLGYVYAHMALLSSPYGGIGITAYPDIGKTTTAILLSKEQGFKALADDMSLINSNANAYGDSIDSISIHAASEYATVLKTGVMRGAKIRYKIGEPLRLLSSIIPPLSRISQKLLTIKLEKLPYVLNVGQGWTKVDHLFILEPGWKEEVTELNYKEARDKFVNICRKEHFMFYFDNNPIFYAYSYINKSFDFFNYLKKRDEILDNFVQNLRTYLIKAPHPSSYASIILRILKT